MTESAGKTFRGLQEAYASIYADKSENLTEDTIANEELVDEYDISEEVLYESMIGYLVHFGYASDAQKAAAILPHMSEEWCKSFALDYVMMENFEYCVEYLVQEGFDFSSTTWDELYETYVDGYQTQNLHEEPVTALATAPVWVPYALAGLGALSGAYALNKKKADEFAANQVQRATDFVMGITKGNRRQSKDRRAEAKRRLRRQQAAQSQKTKQEGSKSETGSTSQGSSGAPQGPQGPKPDWGQRARKFFEPKPSDPLPKPPSLNGAQNFLQGMGDVAKWTGQHIVGRTIPGRVVRAATAGLDYTANRPAQELQGQKPTPTLGGQTLANTIGGASNIVTQTGRFINALTGNNLPAIENIGRLGKRVGQELSDWDKRGTAKDPKKEKQDAKQDAKPSSRNPYGL